MNRKSRGFTLVEILIVVIILGILAAIVIPQFTDASTEARKSSAASTLHTIRSQIELYKVQHDDRVPVLVDYATAADGAATWTNMMRYSNQTATTYSDTKDATNGVIYGPYFQQPPVNPVTNSSKVRIADAAVEDNHTEATPVDNYGWVYVSTTGEIYAVEKTSSGTYVSNAKATTSSD